MKRLQILVTSCGAWYLPNTAKAFQNREALAGLWISDKNRNQIHPSKYRRCWQFHAALKPFLHLAPQIWTERAFYILFPLWRSWINRQDWPTANVVQAIMGFATEPFDRAEQIGALKVVDCPNSHPTSYYGYWQRECDLWCPGEKVPIPQWMFARMNRELERADAILCPSDFVRDTMISNGLSREKCFVNPFGVDTSVFKPRLTVPQKPRFITVGTICVRKGHQYLFRAFDLLKKKMPDAELICVGDYKTDFRNERVRWEGSFTHYPHLPHSDLATLLLSGSAFVLTSVEEGFARVISEAMATGLPIIGSYESGASTQVTDGVEGFIVSPRDTRKLSDAMFRIASNPGLGAEMGKRAYEKGASKNSWQDYGDRLLIEYLRRLEAKRVRTADSASRKGCSS